MSAPKQELFRAIQLALSGKWEAAHEIVQQYEDDPTASWIHAVLHKMEGDLSNSRYWYRRAGRKEDVSAEPAIELTDIHEMLSKSGA
jgi:hypothetical protein